jgi:uncharacterized membrane protein YhhN
MKRIVLGLFIVAALTELMSQIFDLSQIHHIVKPLLMIFLGAYYYFHMAPGERSNVVLIAIFFSFLGDSFLIYEYKNGIYFILGLLSFLLAHLFYIFAFRQHRSDDQPDQLETVQKTRMAFPVILAATGLVVVLYPRLGELRLPVIIYAGVLMFMVLNALFRFRRTTSRSFWMTFSGAVLFMASDSVLAINKFLEPVQSAGVIIMLLYLAGQFLIVRGLILHDRIG